MPASRASDRAMASACLRLFTNLPAALLVSSPCLNSCSILLPLRACFLSNLVIPAPLANLQGRIGSKLYSHTLAWAVHRSSHEGKIVLQVLPAWQGAAA
jgi:hypothetical protein